MIVEIPMHRRPSFALSPLVLPMLAAAVWFASGVPARSEGALETLPIGRYQCSLPGDAGSIPWVPIEKRFSIKNASRYLHPEGSGTYLMTGNDLVFTRGPLKDERYERMGTSILRMKNPDGTLSRIRCVRTGPLQ